MKKLTIFLVMILSVCFVIDSFYEEKKAEELAIQEEKNREIGSVNKQIYHYAGVKKRGSEVKALISLVETLNEKQVFPIDIRYGDVSPDSYEWNEHSKTNPNLNSGDVIRESAWYEVVIQDQLPEEKTDKYFDTITIRAY